MITCFTLLHVYQVHSLATMIAFKMEIPENSWNEDPYGFALANYVNSYLPCDIKVMSILPAQRYGLKPSSFVHYS